MSDDIVLEAKRYVLWLLSRRDYSRNQLEKKLKRRELNEAQISELLAELSRENFFDEKRYQNARTKQLLRRGMGASVVKARLRQEKINVREADIEEAFVQMGSSLENELRAMAEKFIQKWTKKNYSAWELRQRVFKSLLQKGHRASDIQKILQEIAEK